MANMSGGLTMFRLPGMERVWACGNAADGPALLTAGAPSAGRDEASKTNILPASAGVMSVCDSSVDSECALGPVARLRKQLGTSAGCFGVLAGTQWPTVTLRVDVWHRSI